jgi:hypothetical protein
MRVFGLAALCGIAVFVTATSTLHVLQPELSPRDEAVSYYVHGRGGWLLTTGLFGLGLGSLALVLGLARDGGSRSGRWLLAVWTLGVLLGAAFRADPPGRWDEPPTASGLIHGNAAIVAFVALPVAALLLSRAPAERRSATRLLAMAAASSLALFAASLVPVFLRPGPPVLLGVSERMLLAFYAAWLAAAGMRLVRGRPAASA